MSYQGHKNYSYWAVYEWLNNDRKLEVEIAIDSLRDKDKATRYLLATLPETTPDQVKLTFRNVRTALKLF